jgi:stachydrine N-demethylase
VTRLSASTLDARGQSGGLKPGASPTRREGAHWRALVQLDGVDLGGRVVAEIDDVSIIIDRRADGAVVAWLNICPHQPKPMLAVGVGRVGDVRCNQHGWRFDVSGRCIDLGVPQQLMRPSGQCLTQVECVVRDNVVWCLIESEAPSDGPLEV